MLYEQKSFTVPAVGSRKAKDCKHGWLDKKGCCVFCGGKEKPKRPLVPRHNWCSRCHKRAMINLNGVYLCGPCCNGLMRGKNSFGRSAGRSNPATVPAEDLEPLSVRMDHYIASLEEKRASRAGPEEEPVA